MSESNNQSSKLNLVGLPTITPEKWSTQDSVKVYNLDRWGEGFFKVSDDGKLVVTPNPQKPDQAIKILDVIDEVKRQNIQLPVTLRFHDILRTKVIQLNKTFKRAIEEARFTGDYYGVYPVKVNQLREVVEEIVDAGTPFNYGLEAGSKAELLVVLSLNSNRNALTILNGYKDEDYLRLGLLGRKMGRKIVTVIEKFSELPHLIKLAKEMGVKPIIGIRANLSCQGSGRWNKSSGERAKFGLSSAEIVKAIKFLKDNDSLGNLKLFHFHIGSQITDIRTIKDAITEGARIYSKMRKMGAPITYFDVGGGAGIDYDGSRSVSNSSMNYNLHDYVEDVVYILKEVCNLEDVEHPNIVSETGRAVTAHHSCVITNVFGIVNNTDTDFPTERSTGDHALVENMRTLFEDLDETNIQETYNDALSKKQECLNAFKLGILDLEEKAKIETLFWKICKKIHFLGKSAEYIPDEITDLENKLAKQYLCNFSVFQSAMDSWSIGQLLPVMPISKLDQAPTSLCRLADITCDSDGKIDKFFDSEGDRETLPIHEWSPGDEYYMGVFLTGAYQDIMGDMHNLFGRLNEIHVFFDEEDPTNFYIEETIDGNSASQVLTTLQYSPQALAQSVKKEIDIQVSRGKIKPREGVRLVDFYERCLEGYTYLHH